jgi:hypothetical protein
MHFFALLLTGTATLTGTIVSYLYDRKLPLGWRLSGGACTGFGILAVTGFALASALGLNRVALSLTEIALASLSTALLCNPRIRKQLCVELHCAAAAIRSIRSDPVAIATYAVYWTALSLLLLFIFSRAVFVADNEIYTGVTNNLGDLPFHLHIINGFVQGQNLPPLDPNFAGVRLTYSFLPDFTTAMLVCAGASATFAILVQDLILAFGFVGILHRWTWELTKDRSAASIAPMLALFNGGLGWWILLRELRASDTGLWSLLFRLSHDYTILPDATIRWGNILTSLLVPQSGLLFAAPLALCVFVQLWLSFQDRDGNPSVRNRFSRPLAAGLITGMLPLVHAYTYVVVLGMATCAVFLLRRWRQWFVFAGVALLLGGPQMLWLLKDTAITTSKFIGWHLGWDRGDDNILWFWFKNTGLLLPLLIWALVEMWRSKRFSRQSFLFLAPFSLCFIIPNLVMLAPWVWDNIKVLFYWHLAAIPPVAWLLVRWWNQSGGYRFAAIAVVFSLTCAGAIDVCRVVLNTTWYREFDKGAIAAAAEISELSPPQATILHAPTYNSAIYLTGRRSVLGYPGWIWSHGLDAGSREDDIRRIYAGVPEADSLLRKYHVDYVLVGPQERGTMTVNPGYFASHTAIAHSGDYTLFAVEHP